jgi:hypothetical protein
MIMPGDGPDMIIALSSAIHPGRIAEIDATIRS